VELQSEVLVEGENGVDIESPQSGPDLGGVVLEGPASQMDGEPPPVRRRDRQDPAPFVGGAQGDRGGHRGTAHAALAGDDQEPAFEHQPERRGL
jgi:hypothetical protein